RCRDADHPDPPARLTVPAHGITHRPSTPASCPCADDRPVARRDRWSNDRHLQDINVSYIFNAMLSSSPSTLADPIDAPRDERPNLTDELLDELSRWGPRERGGMFRSWHRGSLSIVHLIVLTVLEADGSRSMGDLAEALDVSVASATGIVDRMERRGLVERGRTDDDRRVVMVSLTPTGSVVFGDMRAKRRDRLAALIERLSDAERAGFL